MAYLNVCGRRPPQSLEQHEARRSPCLAAEVALELADSRLLSPRDIDIQILPIGAEHGRSKTEQPRLYVVVLQPEYCREKR
jgi:hypothetical protein